MEHKSKDSNEEQLKSHSLPGTNQAGKGPGPCEHPGDEEKPEGERTSAERKPRENAPTRA
jgi:hypothetical protein